MNTSESLALCSAKQGKPKVNDYITDADTEV